MFSDFDAPLRRATAKSLPICFRLVEEGRGTLVLLRPFFHRCGIEVSEGNDPRKFRSFSNRVIAGLFGNYLIIEALERYGHFYGESFMNLNVSNL